MQVFDGESYKEVLLKPWVLLFWHQQMAPAGEVSCFNLFVFLVLLLVGASVHSGHSSVPVTCLRQPMASRAFELNQLGEEFVLRGLVARVHWILRPVKAFKSYWFQFDSWLQGIKLGNTLDILTLPTLMEGANACGSETASNEEGLHFGTGVCHDYFAPNIYTLVKVDGATPKRWLSKGPW